MGGICIADTNLQRELEETRQTIHSLQAQLDTAGEQISVLTQELDRRVDERTADLTHTNLLLTALSHVAASIERTVDPQHLMTTLGNQLNRLDITYYIALLERESKTLVIRYASIKLKAVTQVERLIGYKIRDFRIPHTRFSFYDDLIEKKHPVFIPESDVMDMLMAMIPDVVRPLGKQVLHLVGLKSGVTHIDLPLVIEGRAMGVLALWGKYLRQDDIPTLSIFAGQVAGALEMTRLHKQIQAKHIGEQETLLGFFQALIELTDRQSVIDLTAQTVQEAFQMPVVSLMFPDAGGKYLVLQGGAGWEEAYYGRYRVDIATSREGQVCLTGHPIQQPDVQNDTAFPYPAEAQLLGIVSSLSVPLLGKEKILGTLCAHSLERRALDANEVHQLSLIASQAAQALERVYWFEAEQRRAEEAETLRRAGAIVASTLNKREAVERILEQLALVVPYDSASVLMLREEGYLEIVGGRGWDDITAVIGMHFPIPGDNPNTAVIQEGQPLIVDNVHNKYPAFQTGPHNHIQSWMGIPLTVHKYVIGMLAIDSKQAAHFTPDHVRLATAFADQVAVTIHNARLYESARRQLDELSVLHAIARAGAEAADEDELLAEATAVLENAFHFNNFGVWFLDETAATLRLHPLYRQTPNMVDIPVPINQGIIGYVARTGQSRRVPDVSRDTHYLKANSQIRSELCVPLKVGGKVIGVINTGSLDLNAFSQEDERFLMTIASQLVATIDRIRSQKARFASDKRLVNLVEMAIDAVISLDGRQRIIQFNRGAEAIFGYSAAEMLGQPLDVLLPEPFRDAHRHLIEAFAASPQMARSMAERGVIYGRTKAGVEFPAEASISKFIQDEEMIFTVILRYITRRRQREREREAILTVASALRSAETRTEMLPIILDQLMALLDADGASFAVPDLAANEAQVELGRGVWAQAAGIRFSLDLGVSDGVIETGRPDVINDLQSHPNYARLPLLHDLEAVAGAPLVAQGQLIGSLWVGRNSAITEAELHLLTAVADMSANAIYRATLYEQTVRHAAELEQRVAERTQELAAANERLQELDKLKSRFVSDVSHELRTPVTVLKLHLALLAHTTPTEKQSKYLQVLEKQGDRLAQLIEDILDLSRLETGGRRAPFALVSLNDLAAQVIAAHQASAEEKALTLTFTPDTDLPFIMAARNQLAQVVTNLIANALNYTPAGTIEVRTSQSVERRLVCLQVRDTGMGIAPEDRAHLFERFYRGLEMSERNIPGTGLGLAIAKEIVDIHGGLIEVESEVGVGATFRVWLPVDAARQENEDTKELF